MELLDYVSYVRKDCLQLVFKLNCFITGIAEAIFVLQYNVEGNKPKLAKLQSSLV